MSFITGMGSCAGCGRTFVFNPLKVPSIRVRGEREPLCEGCARQINENRRRAGLPECSIREDAYEPEEVE